MTFSLFVGEGFFKTNFLSWTFYKLFLHFFHRKARINPDQLKFIVQNITMIHRNIKKEIDDKEKPDFWDLKSS